MNLRQSVWRRGRALKSLFVVIVPFATCMHGTLVLGGDDASATPGVADVRVIPGPASVAIEQELRAADRALVQAAETNDRVAAARLLDSEFTWIDRDGRSRKKSELASRMILLSAGQDANLTVQGYGRVALITGTHRLTPDNMPALFARVWVRKASGWRLLLYQETAAPDATVKHARYGIPRGQQPADCENPCRSLPYKPMSAEGEEIVASYMASEKAVFEGDADAASRIFGDEVLFITPDSAEPVDKAQRIAALGTFKRGGEMERPPTVDSLDLWVFGNAAVTCVEQESAGEMLRATRIWAKRRGQWQLAFSQQTQVQ